MIDDKFVRNVLSPMLLVILLIFLLPALAGAWILIRTEFLYGGETNDTLVILNWLRGFSNLPDDSAGLVIGALPMLIAALAYRSSARQKLNLTGRAALIITLVGAMLSAAVVALINPENITQSKAISGAKESLEIIERAGTTSMRLMLTYFLLLIGQQVPLKEESEKRP